MEPKAFSQQPPCAAASDGASNSAAGDDPEPGERCRREPLPVGNQAPHGYPRPMLFEPREITALFDTRRAAEQQAP
jgi:hypothetical protein